MQPPPHRRSYLGAGRFAAYAGLAGVFSVVGLVEEDFVLAGVCAAAAVLLAWLALVRARRNII